MIISNIFRLKSTCYKLRKRPWGHVAYLSNIARNSYQLVTPSGIKDWPSRFNNKIEFGIFSFY